jgi:hypothetical protein
MQNKTTNEGTSLRELSVDEAEMVGGGFSWGGLFRGAEHAASDVYHGGLGAIGGLLVVAAPKAAKVVGKGAEWAWNKIEHVRLPRAPEGPEGPDVPELPPEIWLG